MSWDERIGLANLVFTHGLVYFKKQALAGDGWRPDGGASLQAYFIGACLLTFKEAHRE